ncbi:Ubiquinone/menaquinone biosynthesis C-methyltransferase UbiE [Microbacterium hydrocarbonoxydans]|uniref:Ubiquinone/menaquinone biosynthesis C-methyltransferase UbiE n=1 Tax=Microbacterium hydrocarbonoxydans TaxID=273678 RepID=A0A0M2HPU3_9MICO|nr:class I SAM-dependent methyltransferase [Microbacterium hydrocarbonoxydans]KJL46501.1 Ubiquinone/menaquinone biosynthesis C-methyltransferase UbiE [Microbacterium hydrocarbonoxydans]
MVDEMLAKSFERSGADYDRFRPGFPSAAAEMLLPAPVEAVLDLGAGTGKFTERLLGRAGRVIAVEPAAAMLDVLRSKLPEVEAVDGTAESIPLPDASVDAVAVAQAFHWFDRERACAEISRVLLPGGMLGLVWNHSDPDCAWDRAAHRVAHPAVGDADSTSASAADDLPGFTFVQHAELRWRERITRADYLGRWSTVSTFLVADEAGREEKMAAIERVLDQNPHTAGRTEFDLPMITAVFLYRRV